MRVSSGDTPQAAPVGVVCCVSCKGSHRKIDGIYCSWRPLKTWWMGGVMHHHSRRPWNVVHKEDGKPIRKILVEWTHRGTNPTKEAHLLQ